MAGAMLLIRGVCRGLFKTRYALDKLRYNCIHTVQYRPLSALPEPISPSKRDTVDYTDLQTIAMKLYSAGIEEVSSAPMIEKTLKYNKGTNTLDDIHSTYDVDKNIHVIAFGKAVTGMARAVEDLLGDHIINAIAVVPDGCIKGLEQAGKHKLLPRPNSKFEFLEGGDANIPDERSVKAANIISELANSLTDKDVLITLMSGGGSGLISMPKPPITLKDKADLTIMLENAGLHTLELNTIRKNLSLIKGGGLAQMAAPAKVISLILSNLPHLKSGEVASGPTTPDYSTPHQALDIFRKYGVESQVPPKIMKLLQDEAKETVAMKWFSDAMSFRDIYSGPKPRYDASNAINILTGSNEIAVGAILSQCAKYEIPACAVVQSPDNSGSRSYGYLFAAVAQYVSDILTRSNRSAINSGLVQCELDCINAGLQKQQLKKIAQAAEEACNMRRPVCLVFTSEITVEVRGSGVGGPCQEVALATAIQLKSRYDNHESLRKCDVQLFSIDSDGMDGSTPVAGAIANCHQGDKIVKGYTAEYYLTNNDSYTFYADLEDGKYQVHTGMTGTDIQNFQILLIRNEDT